MTMDPLAGGNYNDTPESVPQLEVGLYDFRITEAKLEPPKPQKVDYQLIVKAVVETDGPQKGRSQTRYYSIPPSDSKESKDEFKRVMFKQLFLACGVQPEPNGGYDRNKLVGSVFKGEVSARTYTDNGVTKEARDVRPLKPDGSRFD